MRKLKGTANYVNEVLRQDAQELKEHCENAQTCEGCPFHVEPYACRIKEPCRWEVVNDEI